MMCLYGSPLDPGNSVLNQALSDIKDEIHAAEVYDEVKGLDHVRQDTMIIQARPSKLFDSPKLILVKSIFVHFIRF